MLYLRIKKRCKFNLSLLLPCIFFIACSTISTRTAQFIQSGDTQVNNKEFEAAKRSYSQYLKTAAGLGIYRNSRLEAEIHRKLAYVHSAQANYDSSLIELEQALKKDSRIVDNQTNLVNDRTEISLLKAYQGNYSSALSDIDQFIDTLKVSLRKSSDRRAYVNLLLAKARIEFTIGEYEKSENALQECARLTKAFPFEVEKGELYYLLGVLHRDQGKLDQSNSEFNKSIEILRTADLNSASQLHALGDQLFLQGYLESGITKHIEALKEAELSNITPLIIRSHTLLGEAYDFIGDSKQSEYHLIKAIELQKGLFSIGYNNNPLSKDRDLTKMLNQFQKTGQKAGLAKASVELADYLKSNGNLDSSLFYLNQAHEFYAVNSQINLRNSVELKQIETLLDLGRLDSAKTLIDNFQEIQQTSNYKYPYLLGRYMNQTGKNEEAKTYLRKSLQIIENTRSGFSIPSLRANYLGGKNYVYEEMINSTLNKNKLSPNDVIEAFDWNERARSRSFLDMIAAKRIEPFEGRHKAILEKELSNRLKLIKLNQEIQRNSLSSDLIDEYKRTLSKQELLLDSISKIDKRYPLLLKSQISTSEEVRKSLNDNELLVEYWIGKEHSYAWYLSKDTLGLVELPIQEVSLEREISAFRNAIGFNIQDEINSSSRGLHEKLIDPIPLVESFSSIIIIPHRGQNFLPFEALLSSQGEYLIKTHSISYAPSSTIFLAKRHTPEVNGNYLMAMALGNETYGKYEALPGTVLEVQNIARFFDPAQIRIGLESTESAIKSSDKNFGLIHFATHGFLNKKNPLQSYIALNSDSIEDGRLTVSEVFDIHAKSSLTTLSACETALGEVNRGNELIGLSTAFLYSGSNAVVVSLWKVDDKATSILMTNFYQSLSEGLSISESMALARTKVMAIPEYSSNPYYWASFIIVGNGQLPLIN